MAAASTEENLDNLPIAIEISQTGASTAQALHGVSSALERAFSGVAAVLAVPGGTGASAADLELLRSLTAKLEELVGAASATPALAAPPAPPERATALSAPPPVLYAPAPAQLPSLPSRIADGTAPVRPSARVALGPPSLESTQTVRPLTARELADGRASQWFAIQLMLSHDKIHAQEVPSLGIFSEYRLYSVAGPEGGRLMHALRLGFFSTELAAQSVAHYLADYFPAPTIKRVSIAEHERFAEELITPGKDIGAAGQHAIIELVGAPPARPAAAAAAAAARSAVPSVRQVKPSSSPRWGWSRMVKPHRGADR